MNMNTHLLVQRLKDEDQDHEFYPTTNEIIDRLCKDLLRSGGVDYTRRGAASLLDVGAGNGKVLMAVRKKMAEGRNSVNIKMYAIEKSLILCQQLPQEVFIIGTEFAEQELLSKSVDVTFCNPPYSQFEGWAEKIIRQSASKLVYLVLPKRWAISKNIAAALKYRQARSKVIGSFDFEDAEDRKARAVVDLIRVELNVKSDDAFERFFDAEFSNLKERFEQSRSRPAGEEQKKDPRFTDLVAGGNFIEALVSLYNAQMDRVKKNYTAIASLDVDLLRECEVSPDRILGFLKNKLAGLKQLYWQELFSRMHEITNRLTSKKRKELLGTLDDNGHVDFTVSNIHAVVLWILRTANGYINTQLMEVFDEMLEQANVKNYKSNQKPFVYNHWRYEQERPTHIMLEYRIVLQHSGGIRVEAWSSDPCRGLEERAGEHIQDLLTVAYNLGFDCNTVDNRLLNLRGWEAGAAETFYFKENGVEKDLLEVRAFKNGNMHIRLNQQFALALNVENGRLRGWIHTKAEAVAETGDAAAGSFFQSHIQLAQSSLPMLCANNQQAA